MVVNGEHVSVPVALAPGSELIVFSGKVSDRFFSFRENICSGYLNDQLPEHDLLRRVSENCPDPEDFPIPSRLQSNRVCMEEIDDIRRCERAGSLPNRVPRECGIYIRETYTYNGCVDVFQNSPDFHLNRWRVYLDLNDPLWEEDDDVILLKNEAGVVVDTFVD